MIGAGAGGAVVAGILGLILGSFANVCIHRIPSGESIVLPRSRCPACGAPIRWHDNLPIVSWLLLGARCRDCRSRIPWIYPAVEAAMGAGFLAAYLKYGAGLDGAAAAWFVFACVALAAIDLKHFLLPDVLTLSGAGAGLAFALARAAARAVEGSAPGEGWSWLGGWLETPALPLSSLAGAAAGAAVPLAARGGWILLGRLRGAAGGDEGREEPEALEMIEEEAAKGAERFADGPQARGGPDREIQEAALAEGMGLGDVKMLAMVGAFLGAQMALVTVLLGSLLGCLVILPYLRLARRSLRTPIPFGPFLAAGAVAALFAGEDLVAAYADLLRTVTG